MEVLTTYIPQNVPAAPQGEPSEKPLPERPRTDIQAILTVLGRRLVGPEHERPDRKTRSHFDSFWKAQDLTGANLRDADLWLANLQDARNVLDARSDPICRLLGSGYLLQRSPRSPRSPSQQPRRKIPITVLCTHSLIRVDPSKNLSKIPCQAQKHHTSNKTNRHPHCKRVISHPATIEIRDKKAPAKKPGLFH